MKSDKITNASVVKLAYKQSKIVQVVCIPTHEYGTVDVCKDGTYKFFTGDDFRNDRIISEEELNKNFKILEVED